MRQPNVLTFAGDWHGNTGWASNLIYFLREEHNTDLIIHAGDFGYTFADYYLNGLEDACIENDVNILFVDGNHDDHGRIWDHPVDDDGFHIMTEHVRAIPRGRRFQIWGKTFLGLGGATSVDKDGRTPLISWWPTESITVSDAWKAAQGGPVDVMITHDCPSGVKIPGITWENGIKYFPAEALHIAEAHRVALGKIVDEVQPNLLVHGHYHVRYEDWRGDTKVVGLDMDGTSLENNTLTVDDVDELEWLWQR